MQGNYVKLLHGQVRELGKRDGRGSVWAVRAANLTPILTSCQESWAHGLVHLLYLAPDVPEFSLGRSWLLPEPARRPVARVLMAATVAGFALVALAVWGVPGLSAAWPALTVVACLLSM